MRESVDDWHKAWFKIAVDMAEEQGITPSISRTCVRQTHCSNVEADSPEVY